MNPIPDDAARSDGIYHQCMKELQKPHPDYVMVQALAKLSLVAAIQEVARHVAEVSHQVTLAPRR